MEEGTPNEKLSSQMQAIRQNIKHSQHDTLEPRRRTLSMKSYNSRNYGSEHKHQMRKRGVLRKINSYIEHGKA